MCRWLLRRTACNRTPHCRAAPQTICLRFFVGWCEKKKQPDKIRKKTFLQLKKKRTSVRGEEKKGKTEQSRRSSGGG